MRIFLLVAFAGISLFATSEPISPKTVTVYTYDSLASKGSYGRFLAAELEKEKGIKTSLVSFSTEAEAINQLKLEGANTRADILWGFDGILLQQVESYNVLEKLDEKILSRVSPKTRMPTEYAVPFDYGYLGFIYDSRRTKRPSGPVKLTDWVKDPAIKKKVIIEDPRTSTLGQSFLAWVGSLVSKENYLGFWKGFSPALLTVAPGWSSAYGAFLKKECDYVLSYTTSPAYHIEEEKTDAFKSVEFVEGNYRQPEGVAIIRFSKQKDLASQWITYLLSEKMQAALPLKQWMYPAVDGIVLPAAFLKLPKVVESPRLEKSTLEENRILWTKQWTRALTSTP